MNFLQEGKLTLLIIIFNLSITFGQSNGLDITQVYCANPILCGNNTSASLKIRPFNSTFTYSWTKQVVNGGSVTYLPLNKTDDSTLVVFEKGMYFLNVNDNLGNTVSRFFEIVDRPLAKLTNLNDNNDPIVYATGSSVSLKLKLQGEPPFVYTLNGNLSAELFTSNTNEIIHTFFPEYAQYYGIGKINNNCPQTGNSSNIQVIETPAPTIAFSAPTTSSTCKGGRVVIPFTKNGNWPPIEINIRFDIPNSGGATFNGENPVVENDQVSFSIPQTIFDNTYTGKVYVNGVMSFSFTHTITNVTCPSVSISSYPVSCEEVYIFSTAPSYSGPNITWYRNNQEVLNSNHAQSNFIAKESGNYKVKYFYPATGIEYISNEIYVNVKTQKPLLNATNTLICDNNINATFSIANGLPSDKYQWYYSATSTYASLSTALLGETASSITKSIPGYYFLSLNRNGCISTSDAVEIARAPKIRVKMGANFTNTVNSNTGTVIPIEFHFSGNGPWVFDILEGKKVTTIKTTSNPYVFNLNPSLSTKYIIKNLTNSCGFTENAGTYTINLNNEGFNFNAWVSSYQDKVPYGEPISILFYSGQIPFQNYPNASYDIQIKKYPGNEVVFTSKNHSFQNDYRFIPGTETLPLGTYYATLSSNFPYLTLAGGSINTYNFTVDNVLGYRTQLITASFDPCKGTLLETLPHEPGIQRRWYKDNVLMPNITSDKIFVTVSGSYKTILVDPNIILPTNITFEYYISTLINNTQAEIVTIEGTPQIPIVTSSNPVICGSNTYSTLSTTMSGDTYQWYKEQVLADGSTDLVPLLNANSQNFTTYSLGKYAVKVKIGNCYYSSKSTYADTQLNPITTESFLVSNSPIGKISNANNQPVVNITQGSTTNLKVDLYGSGPFNIVVTDGSDNFYHSTSFNSYQFPVSPSQSTLYKLVSVDSDCGLSSVSGTAQVNVGAIPDLNFGNPPVTSILGEKNEINSPKLALNTTVCAGSMIEIPYDISGLWGANRNVAVELVNQYGSLVPGSLKSGFFSNPIKYQIPSSTPLGSYRLRISSLIPYIDGYKISPYLIDISSSGCTQPTATLNVTSKCSEANLEAFPQGSSYSYEWFRNNVTIPNANQANFLAKESGDYKVKVTGTNFNSTSDSYTLSLITLSDRVIQTGNSICDNTGSLKLSSFNYDAGNVFKWFYAENGVGFDPIPTNDSILNVSSKGTYFVVVKNGTCEKKSEIVKTCKITSSFISKSICKESSVNFPFVFLGDIGTEITIDLLNTSNTTVTSNIKSLISSTNTEYLSTINLPASIQPGNYKFKINAGLSNIISEGILTVINQNSVASPDLTLSTMNISSPTLITVSASGCLGDLKWNNSDGITQLAPSFSKLLKNTVIFSVFCANSVSGCNSPIVSKTVNYNCFDAFEPNNTVQSATVLASANVQSPTLCLDNFANGDWFKVSVGNKEFYFSVHLKSPSSDAGNYKLKVNTQNNILTIETMPVLVGESLDTYLILKDSDGTTTLFENDNGNSNGFSKIEYSYAPPCLTANILNSTNDDISNEVIVKEANAITGTISATNKITGNANVTYRAGKSISLEPGFKADNGVVFKTEFGGCN